MTITERWRCHLALSPHRLPCSHPLVLCVEAELTLLDDTPTLAQHLNGFVTAPSPAAPETAASSGGSGGSSSGSSGGQPSSVQNNVGPAVQLRAYTRALRLLEAGDEAFAIALAEETAARFGAAFRGASGGASSPSSLSSSSSSSSSSSLDSGSWGVTYMPSFFRVFGHPLVQRALRQAVAAEQADGERSARPPKVILIVCER